MEESSGRATWLISLNMLRHKFFWSTCAYLLILSVRCFPMNNTWEIPQQERPHLKLNWKCLKCNHGKVKLDEMLLHDEVSVKMNLSVSKFQRLWRETLGTLQAWKSACCFFTFCFSPVVCFCLTPSRFCNAHQVSEIVCQALSLDTHPD